MSYWANLASGVERVCDEVLPYAPQPGLYAIGAHLVARIPAQGLNTSCIALASRPTNRTSTVCRGTRRGLRDRGHHCQRAPLLLATSVLAIEAMVTACHISERLKGCCDTCGEWPGKLHMPEELHGWYCSDCCPACHPDLLKPARVRAFEPAQQAA